MIRESLAQPSKFPTIESRFLLIMTSNNAAVELLSGASSLQGVLRSPIPIHGSSFPSDVDSFPALIQTVNRIKGAMEQGKTVLLMNCDTLYECLYDLLNQSYTTIGGRKYVQLGLGHERKKVCVHDQFQLIVVADREHVQRTFPVPLKNRFEKHFLAHEDILTPPQLALSKSVGRFVKDRSINGLSLFVGVTPELIGSLVNLMSDNGNIPSEVDVRRQLLRLAAPDYPLLNLSTDETLMGQYVDTNVGTDQCGPLENVMRQLESGQVRLSSGRAVTMMVCTTYGGLPAPLTLQQRLPKTDIIVLHDFYTEREFVSRIRAVEPGSNVVVLCDQTHPLYRPRLVCSV